MNVRLVLAGLLLYAAVSHRLLAADESPAAAPSTASPSAAVAQAHFKQTFDEFKQVLGQLRTLHGKFQLAKDADRPAIMTEFNRLLAKGKEIAPGLQAAAIELYRVDPKNCEVSEFLMVNVADEVDSDHYQKASELLDLLTAGGFAEKGLANFAGIVAFRTDNFAEAKAQLSKASKEGAINKVAEELLKQVDEYVQLWEVEQKVRAVEQQTDDLPRVKLTTTKGDIVVELFENEAPIATANFINLVEKHFYDGLKFHRVLSGFMAQGGDPKGNGSGGPGYTIPCECFQENHRNHFAGSLSMAHAGRDTGGSQFFLTFTATPNLNGKHTVFGRVIEGMDVLTSLQRIDPDHPDANVTPDEIVKATVLRKRDHAYEPEKASGK